MLYEVAIIKKPTKKEMEDGTGKEELLLAPTCVLAANPQGAVIVAVTKDGGVKGFDADQCEVLVRPFGLA